MCCAFAFADNFGETSDTDCPVFDGIFDFCQIYAGGSLGMCEDPTEIRQSAIVPLGV